MVQRDGGDGGGGLKEGKLEKKKGRWVEHSVGRGEIRAALLIPHWGRSPVTAAEESAVEVKRNQLNRDTT